MKKTDAVLKDVWPFNLMDACGIDIEKCSYESIINGLSRISDSSFTILSAKYNSGLTHQQIADLLGIEKKDVDRRVRMLHAMIKGRKDIFATVPVKQYNYLERIIEELLRYSEDVRRRYSKRTLSKTGGNGEEIFPCDFEKECRNSIGCARNGGDCSMTSDITHARTKEDTK